MNQRDGVLKKVGVVPGLPAAATQIIALLQDPDVEINALMRTIEYDPGLTSNVLRLANSAFFAGPRTIGSLREAIMRLGTNRIFQLAITSAIAPMARQALLGYDLPPGELLAHSIATAIGAEELARLIKRPCPPFTFTAGLLHDVGKILLSTFVQVDAAPIVELAERENLSFEVAEYTVLGIDHAEAGALLLERWNLPLELVEAARWHHQPAAVTGDTLLVDLVHVADQLSSESGMGAGVDGLNYRISHEVVSRLMLNTNTAELVLCKMISGVDQLRDAVGIVTRR